jgi:hypothetical protein
VVVTRGSGYALEVDPGDLESVRFEQLAGEARAALGAGDPARAVDLVGRGLGLWRGSALADVAGEPFAQAEIARLVEVRAAVETELEAELGEAAPGAAALQGGRARVGGRSTRGRANGIAHSDPAQWPDGSIVTGKVDDGGEDLSADAARRRRWLAALQCLSVPQAGSRGGSVERLALHLCGSTHHCSTAPRSVPGRARCLALDSSQF